MEGTSIPVFFFTLLFLLLSSDCASLHNLSANQAIKDGETIVSDGEMFELGFFSPGRSTNRYVGIWYKKISTQTVVWVANRETPITDTSGMFKVSREGNLLVTGGGDAVIWSSNSTLSARNLNPVVQLLDTGNLVLWDESSTKENPVWQSFDYPSDNLLPGIKFGKDLVTGRERYLTSWKSPDDPSIGLYSDRVDTNGYPQLIGWRGQVMLSRLGPWNGLGFSGFPSDIPNPFYSVEFVINEKEIYHKFELTSTVVQRVFLTWDGKTLHMHWLERTQEWAVYQDMAVDGCGRFALCGPYGMCSSLKHPPCSCMEGFEPRHLKQWKVSDWSSGCRPKKPFNCGIGDGFQKFKGVKLPDTGRSWYNVSMTLAECEVACRRKCSCTAYTNLDIRKGGSGCLLWFEALMDIREYETGQDLYVRVAASELKDYMVYNRRQGVLIIILPISLALLLLSALAYAHRIRKKTPLKKGQGNRESGLDKKNSSMQMEHLDDLPFFSLYKVAAATDNFSSSNKIGEGGFGPVYKGVLEDGREVAVKRLSETSQQGFDEFKNEAVCIAKLQHRNLVKLLGYCINDNEMMLIYEYMANKSLDSFLFDEGRSSMLDWPQRFRIIHGTARGILYLHQDSRLQIIHRDLKAANILLDSDMNPKISDFGLARKFVGNDTSDKTKKVVGTYGYISPEYAVHGRFSIKSDVFSFGVLVLEIVSGMKNREFSHEDHRDNLLGHAWRLYKEDKSMELISESIRTSCVIPEVLRSIHVALLCVQHHAEDRPTMLSVVLMLVSDSALPPPKQPAFFTEENSRELDPVSSVDEYMITLLYAR
ncbi:G-type lectin S-receptor-like serine/threonine-protein kinase At4g27290 [Cynara cardunculus var. scolymus]|uniref:Receptor-like serine/threonine-protein kinase n=1 Tax=Cynara cardunculus var. scolymus TaxID=59895 RepID=A0A103Y9H4_CYNCS|nr:G-type lectin S-receptor-like serine/threonine-protein kinase At4g27290 [Cynara cardunculus var. scolymus]KVI04991.1 Apple-like protein [Cynara cardunculus var. scolymus]